MSAERKALAGAASDGSIVGSHAVTYRLSGRPMRTTACRFRCVGQCLSRMRRKVQVRFLGEGAAATPLPYPTYSTGRHKWARGFGFEDTLALIRKLRSKSGIHPATLRLVALVLDSLEIKALNAAS